MKKESLLKSLNLIKNGDMSELDFLIDVISKEIKEAELTKSNGADYVKLSKKAARILKGNVKDCFKNAAIETINGEDMQTFFDNGYYCVALYKPLDIPTVSSADKNFNAKSIFEKMHGSQHKEIAYDIGDIKLALVSAVDKKHPYVEVGNNRYNAQFFLNIVEFLGGADKVKFYQAESSLSPACFESELGKAVLCPVSKRV